MSRPRLKSHARPLLRAPGTVQLGLAPPAGAVLEGLTEAEVRWLERLDGTTGHALLYAEASAAGIPPQRVEALLDTLRDLDLLVEQPTDRACLSTLGAARWAALGPDADTLAAVHPGVGDGWGALADRQGQHVLVGGDGTLARSLALLLRRAGIGRVETGAAALDALELGLRAAGRPVTEGRSCATGRSGAVVSGSDRPDLVVLLGSGALDPGAGAPWLRHGIPHLPVVAQGHRVLVGPLVAGPGGPCLQCCDLDRSDRDPQWPRLLAQLTPPQPVGRPRPVEAATGVTATAAGLAALLVHSHLDAGAVPRGVSLELSLPWPTVVHRRWSAHPRCGCGAVQAHRDGVEASTPGAG
ncbi:MAG: hypothetical protein ACXVYU_08655 [Oryzihumus sp.]